MKNNPEKMRFIGLCGLGAVLTLGKTNLAMLSKELLPWACPRTPCHFMVQFAVRSHPSHQTNPLSWWNPAVLPEHGSSTCQLLALTDVFVKTILQEVLNRVLQDVPDMQPQKLPKHR